MRVWVCVCVGVWHANCMAFHHKFNYICNTCLISKHSEAKWTECGTEHNVINYGAPPTHTVAKQTHTHTVAHVCGCNTIQVLKCCLCRVWIVCDCRGNVDNCFKRLLVENLVVLPLLRFVVLLLEIRSNICRDRQADGGGGQTAGRGRGDRWSNWDTKQSIWQCSTALI